MIIQVGNVIGSLSRQVMDWRNFPPNQCRDKFCFFIHLGLRFFKVPKKLYHVELFISSHSLNNKNIKIMSCH
jgi:hypothetical protein